MQLIQQLQDISLPQHPFKDSYALNIKDKVKMWLLGLEGGGSTVLWSISSTETFLGTATKGFSLYYCYLHCKGSLPFKCGKSIGQIVFPPAGKQEQQEKRCAAEDEPMLVSCTRVQRGSFWGIHTLYRTPVSNASWFTHGSRSDGRWMSLHQKTPTKIREGLKTETLQTSETKFLRITSLYWMIQAVWEMNQLPVCPPLPWTQTEGRNAGHISGTPAGRQRGTSGTSYP